MLNMYYLHFEHTVSQSILDTLAEEGSVITPVFATSFSIESDLSHGLVKRIIKTAPDFSPCILVKAKQHSEFLSLSEDSEP